ncbi:MAG: glycine cleavage system aminomethyltransferase GcvT [Chitinispirillales bacterium]|jgi:aminomethyltransferase|nr:glycine cleavage system aminomethyltransferase GcvT [Chitinispirillales bacterium]
MKKTPIHPRHLSLSAKMAPFAGYEMPLHYEGYGVIKEHEAARTGAALFDTCHMGVFHVGGIGGLWELETMLSCDIEDMKVGACRYGFMCNHAGGVIDDMIVYRMNDKDFMLVTNAVNEKKVLFQLKNYTAEFTWFRNDTESTAKIDVQGPKSPKIVAGLMREPIDGIKFYNFAKNFYRDAEVIVSRTGYTGEIGFEVYCPVEAAGDFWDDCVAAGAVPAGLGARDILRLEMGFPLYGHELGEDRNAAQSGFSRALSGKKDFIGSGAALDPLAAGQILCGISLEGRRSARQGDAVLDGGGTAVGVVTSGSFSPSLGHAIALAYVDKNCAVAGTALRIVCGKAEIAGKACQPPFYKNATARADIKLYL